MMKRIFGKLPHCAILIGNMYYVFFGIDRVNTAMAFIDNNITKGLLAIMCAMSIACAVRLLSVHCRIKGAKLVPMLDIIACIACIMAIAADYIWQKLLLFDADPAKFIALAACLLTLANGVILIRYNRRPRKKRRRVA